MNFKELRLISQLLKNTKKSVSFSEIPTFLTELLYPKRCPTCDGLLKKREYDLGFCVSCRKKVRVAGNNVCMKCGKVINSVSREYCGDCEKHVHCFDQGKALYLYTGEMKNAMYRFKYSNRRCYAKTFSKEAARLYGRFINEHQIEAIIPVPMYGRKSRKRGYNQAEVFANALGSEIGLIVYPNYIKRIRDTQPLKLLGRHERCQNLQNAFKLSDNKVKLRKVLLVDDIYTTGSTMDEIARVLKADGVEQIYCLCICTGEGN